MFKRILIPAVGLLTALGVSGCGSPAATGAYQRLGSLVDAAAPPEEDPRSARPLDPLTREGLIRAVLRRNPRVEEARQVWKAMLLRVPQQTAFADPELSYSVAPLSVGSPNTPFGQTITLRQPLPYPGKRNLRGETALAEARVAGADWEAVRLGLAAAASRLYDEYFVLGRAVVTNRTQRDLAREGLESMSADYAAGRIAQGALLDAEMELARLEQERIQLDAAVRVVRADLARMLHENTGIPDPPVNLDSKAPPDLESLLAEARERHPELKRHHEMGEAAESRRRLAEADYRPDLALFGSYSTMWRETEHRWMLGVSLDVPLRRETRRAAVGEQEARATEHHLRHLAAEDDVRFALSRAQADLQAAQESVVLHEERLLPVARDRVVAARAAFESGRGSLSAVLAAERERETLELERQKALIAVAGARADLLLAAGIVPGGQEGERP